MPSFADRVSTTVRRRRRRLRRWYQRRGGARVIGTVVVSLLVIGGLVFALQAFTASSDLRRAASQATVLQDQIVTGNAGAAGTLEALQRSTASAKDQTDGFLWSIGSRIPILGNNVGAVRAVSAILDDVATTALPPVVEVSSSLDLDAFSPQGGTIDLANVVSIAPAVAAADASLTSARADLDKVDSTGLLLPLREPIATVKDRLVAAQSAAASANVAARLMPTMLGQGETRRYLLLIQNNAEVRATGGIPGSYAVITARNGRIKMGQQGSIFDLPQFTSPVVPLTSDEKTVFTEQMVRDLRDITVTPDFPRTGEIARAMARDGLDTDIDGVISVDPVAMSYILGGTGPVTLDSGVTLDQTTAVDLLLSQVYLAFTDLDAQDDFFEAAARKIFDAVTSGTAQSRPVIAAMVRAATENRLTMWSSHPDEQAQIRRTGLSGAFATDEGSVPHLGVYFGDAVGGKMQYYFDFTTVATSTRCLEGGRQLITMTTELVSSAPLGLPARVAGIDPDVPAGEMRLITWLYAPFGGRFTDIRLDGESQLITTAELDGRAETSVPVTLAPGQRRTLTATVVTGPGQDADGVLSTTPGIRTIVNDLPIASACG